MAGFLILLILGSIVVGIALSKATRPSRSTRATKRTQTRPRGRPATRVRRGSRSPSGGRSSRPRYQRTVRCATYEIPSFDPNIDAYIGMSTRPELRIEDHMVKWWWAYVKQDVGVFTVGKKKVIRGITITWYDNEDLAYEAEQAMIGKRQPLFCIEGNFGRGIPGPTHPRAITLQRRYIQTLKRSHA